NDRAKQFGTELERYGRLLSPFKFLPGIGNVVEMLSESAKRAGTYIQEKTALGSVRAQRAKIEHALHELGKRVVIVIDDIDRLEVGEIRDVMRLVRLTADFPGVRYLLAFDRARVEKALGEGGEGRAYLEKIFQVTIHVPEIRQDDLIQFLLEELDTAVKGK